MPRGTATLRDLCASTRQSDGGGRLTDLRVDFVAQDGGDRLLCVGGVWDKIAKRYDDDAEAVTALELGMHPGQVEPTRWFRSWLEAYARGERVTVDVLSQDGQTSRPMICWTCLCAGGRRGGKTDFCIKCAVAFAVTRPNSRVWLISENIPKTEELDEVVVGYLPQGWYKKLGSPWFKYTLINGSTIHLRSAHDPEALKRGRCDFAVFNEAQNINERAFTIVRAAIADTGGLVMLAANPPEEAVGQWVADAYEESKAQRRAMKLFEFDARLNPHVEHAALEDMQHEVDERTYRIEILGEFLARQEVVFYNWSPRENVRPVPELGNVTPEFLRRHLGRPFARAIGADFQLVPHMAAVVYEAFIDPLGGLEPLLWIVDEVLVENGDEDDLVDELERRGYTPGDSAVIADASGEWQDAERTRGRGSFDVLRRRGWRNIYTPDPKAKRNPLVTERVKVANNRMRTADGMRHVFSSPANFFVNRALRLWENRNGVPYKRSDYAHLCDAATYPLWRFYPRKATRGRISVERVDDARARTTGRAEEFGPAY